MCGWKGVQLGPDKKHNRPCPIANSNFGVRCTVKKNPRYYYFSRVCKSQWFDCSIREFRSFSLILLSKYIPAVTWQSHVQLLLISIVSYRLIHAAIPALYRGISRFRPALLTSYWSRVIINGCG